MRLLFALVTILLVAATTISAYHSYSRSPAVTPQHDIKTVVTLSPSVTEVMYFLDEWDKVAAVSRYSEFPPEVADKPKLSGIQDINYEAVVAMAPDLVILSDMQHEGELRLRSLGLNTLLVYQHTFDNVLESIRIIGEAVGAEERAELLVDELSAYVAGIADTVKGYERRSVIFVMSREVGSGSVNNLVAAGSDGYYSRILELLNADNPFEGNIAYSTVSKEGIYDVNPDVVIELVYSPELEQNSKDEWMTSMSQISALHHGRVCTISDSYGYVPGPRFPLLVDAVARSIYPESLSPPESLLKR